MHVAEVSSFLKTYLRYVNPALSEADRDRYFEETSMIARLLGARDVPTTRAAIESYLDSMRPQLQASVRTQELTRVLKNAPTPHIAMKPASKLMFSAGVDLLPDWAQEMLGLSAMEWRPCGARLRGRA